jgi:type IV pilus assembly protein PilA
VLATLKARRDREEGFTLIELMVVVLIIAILIAIAIPTFLGARERAQERAAQSSVRNGLTAAKTIFTDTESYTLVSATTMEGVEPSLEYTAESGVSTDKNQVSWTRLDLIGAATDHEGLVLAAESQNGKCFVLMDLAVDPNAAASGAGQDAGTFFGSYTVGAGTCHSNYAPGTAPSGGWKTAW